jgi:hypothetical protein
VNGDNRDFSRVAFVSSGDAEVDARTAAGIRQRMAREAEGMCPNGCAPIVILSDYEVTCAVCGFHGHGEAYVRSALSAGIKP